MTHHTDAERAEFEAWRIDETRKDMPKADVTDGHIRHVFLRWSATQKRYLARDAQIGWEAWKAARRAPAAPVPQGWKLVPVELLERIQESLGSFVSDQGWSQSDMDTADALDGLLAAAPQPPEAEDLGKKLQDAQRRSDFFKRRCDLLQIVQRCMRDPERTLVCDVLANGHLLHDVDSEAGKARYLAPEAAPVQLPEPVAKIFFDRKCCEVSELPAWENLRPYGTHELVSVQQVRQLLANHGIQEQST